MDKDAWKQAIREAFGKLDDLEVADRTGLSQPWMNQVKNGRRPSREALITIVEKLGVAPELRARLFYLAGYADPDAPPPMVAEPRGEYEVKARAFDRLLDLSERSGKPVPLDARRWRVREFSEEEVARILRTVEEEQAAAAA